MPARKTAATAPKAFATMSSARSTGKWGQTLFFSSAIAKKWGLSPFSLVPEVLRGLGVLLRQRLHARVHRARRQALGFELRQPRLGDLGADLAELGVFLRRKADRLGAAVDERLLADRGARVPAFAYFLLDAFHGAANNLLQFVGRLR